MKRVAFVVILALINAVAFGITPSSAAPPPPTGQSAAEQTHQAEIYKKASRIPSGRVVRIVYLDGTQTDAVLDRVLPDTIEILFVTRDSRVPATVPMGTIKKITELKGEERVSSLKAAGIGLAVLTGLCLAAVGAGG